MNNLVQRTLTGSIFVAAIIGAVCFHIYAYGILFLIFTILGVYEFYTNLEKSGIKPQKYLGITISALLIISAVYYAPQIHQIPVSHFVWFIPLLFIIGIIELYRKQEQPFHNIAFTWFGILYIAVPFALMAFLFYNFTSHTFHFIIPLGIFLLTWTNDTFAYLTGMALGKHRLWERISPKKSWEGFFGGTLFSLIAAFTIAYFDKTYTLCDWLIISCIVSVCGTFGDLFESLFKRSLQIKDSGNILPGHGGILDRFDSVLFIIPFVFTYLLIKFSLF